MTTSIARRHLPRRFGPLMAVLMLAVMMPPANAQTAAGAAPAATDAPQSPAGAPPTAAYSPGPPKFVDNNFSYSYGSSYRNPFIANAAQPGGADIARSTVEFTHFDAWKYGHNFVDIIVKKSNVVEPAAGGGTGAVGFYSIFRSGFSINHVTGKPLIALGPLRDIDLQAGLNYQIKNTALAPNERSLYFGPNLRFLFGSGFLCIGLQLRKEWNYNGILGKNESFDVDFNIEPVWKFPFRIGRAQLQFEGYADFNTAKGKDASGRETHAEFIARPQLNVDISPAFGLPSGLLRLGVGVEYWHNLFGKDASVVPGAKQSTPVVSLIVHWPTGKAH